MCISQHGCEKYSNSCGKWICKSKNQTFLLPPGKTLFPVPITTPRQSQITHPKLGRGGLFQTYFKMYCFKSTFLKHVTEEFTFCWKVLLVTLSKNLVAAITEFLSLFLNIVINIYIQWHVLYRPEFKVTPITLHFSSTKYKYRIITNVYM